MEVALRRLAAAGIAALGVVVALFLSASISVWLRGIVPAYPTWRLIAQVPFAVAGIAALEIAAVRLWRGDHWARWALGAVTCATAAALVAFLHSSY